MRVLIRVDHGGPHGLGHSTRMRALAHALTARGCEVGFRTATPALLPFVSPFPCQHVKHRETDADVCIVDTKGQDAAYTLPGVQMVRIDNPGADAATTALLVAPSAHWADETITALQRIFGPRFLHGFDYVLLDEAVTSQPPLPYAERLHGPIVFCAGGSDPTGILEQMWDWSETLLPAVDKLFLIGQHSHGALRERLGGASWVLDTPTSREVSSFAQAHLRTAALCVCPLGVTVYEAIYNEVPTLCFARTLDDVARLKVLSDATDGGLVACGLFARATREWFCGLVQQYWEDATQRQAMAAACAGRIDGLGAERVANTIMRRA